MTLISCVLWMTRLAGIAAFVNAVELLTLSRTQSRSLSDNGIWRAQSLSGEWGILRYLFGPRTYVALLLVQAIAAVMLIVVGGDRKSVV